jgi:hypothetical protein
VRDNFFKENSPEMFTPNNTCVLVFSSRKKRPHTLSSSFIGRLWKVEQVSTARTKFYWAANCTDELIRS